MEAAIFVVYKKMKMRVPQSVADELGLRKGQTVDDSMVKKIAELTKKR